MCRSLSCELPSSNSRNSIKPSFKLTRQSSIKNNSRLGEKTSSNIRHNFYENIYLKYLGTVGRNINVAKVTFDSGEPIEISASEYDTISEQMKLNQSGGDNRQNKITKNRILKKSKKNY